VRKELFIAIFLGGFVGLALAFGAWRFTNSFSKDNDGVVLEDKNSNTEQQALATSIPTSTDGITIVRPQENSVSKDNTVEIAGIARPNSTVIIVAGDDEILQTKSGTFEQEIELVGGINTIPIFMMTEDGKTQETSVSVIYSSEIENMEAARSILGTITDITKTSIQIRTSSGEISQIAISDDTSYASTVQTSKEITFEDVAIGDFVAAIGPLDDDEVINAERIIVSSPPAESDIVIAYGQVDTLTNNDFIVKNEQAGDEWSIDATDSPTVTTVNNEGEIVATKLTTTAEEGSWIIIIGTMEEDELVARTIHIL